MDEKTKEKIEQKTGQEKDQSASSKSTLNLHLNSIFRVKNLERAANPEELDKYLKVTGVGAWAIVIAGALLVVFILCWAALGKLDHIVHGAGQCEDGVLTCYFRVTDIGDLSEGTSVLVADQDFTISKINPQYFLAEDLPREVLYLSQESNWYQTATVNCDLEDGFYPVMTNLEDVSPLSFLVSGK